MELTRRSAAMLAATAAGLTALALASPGSAVVRPLAVAGVGALVVALVWLSPALPRRRLAWWLVGAWAALLTVGGIWFEAAFSDRARAVPSPADAVYVASYACLVAGIVLLFHRPLGEAPRSEALDGVLLGLAAATLAEATVLARVAGAPADQGWAVAAVSRAYLVFDLCLAGTVVLLAGTDLWRSWRWRLLGGAAAALLVADIGYLRRVGDGDLSGSAWYHPLYVVAGLLLAGAAWAAAPRPRARPAETLRMVLLPGGVAAVAAAVLLWDHFDPRTSLGVWLATAALVAVAVRAGLTVQYLRQLVDARRLALTDDLTGLPNRRWFLDQLRRRAEADPPAPFALLLVGIDRFKDLNDTLGHEVGDRVLRDSAARLGEALGPAAPVARLGGDEFAILVAGDERAARSAAAAVLASFARPADMGGIALVVDVSVGGAVFPDGGVGVDGLLRRADVALHDAKRSDDHRAMYRAERDPYSLDRLSLGAELRGAIADGGLTVLYQPIADLRTGRFRCAEALVRWDHPRHGLLLPDRFLDVAQQTGSMRSLTAVVLDAALEQCGRWRAGGLDVAVCVNLPPSALLDAGLAPAVAAALDHAGLPADALGLELTENGLLEDPETALTVLRALREVGVRLAVDDYGTGYASLSYLRDLPVQSLKIDRSFLAGIVPGPSPEPSRNGALVRSTIMLAHELGFEVVAEGVEDARTLAVVEGWGVDAVQGYFVGRPVPGPAVAEACRTWESRRSGRAGGGAERGSRRGAIRR